MGTSVCTYHIRNCTQDQCLQSLPLVHSPQAFVSTVTNNWLTVVDANSESFDLEALEKTIASRSRLLSTTIIETGVYDNDESFYVAFHAGIEIDRFATSRDVFHWLAPQKFPGNPAQLAAKLPWWTGQDLLIPALKNKIGIFKMESTRLKKIVRAFDIPETRAFTKLHDLSHPQPHHAKLLASLPPESEFAQHLRDRQQYKPFPPHKDP